MAQRTAVLHPGECIILPRGAVVTSVIQDGAITATSSCGTLPTPTAYKCGYFLYVRDDQSGGGPFDEGVVQIKKLTVGGVTYVMNEDATNPDLPSLNLHITDLALFEFMAVTVAGDYSERKYYALYFKTPASLFDTASLQIDERGNGVLLINLPPIEHECDDYPADFV